MTTQEAQQVLEALLLPVVITSAQDQVLYMNPQARLLCPNPHSRLAAIESQNALRRRLVGSFNNNQMQIFLLEPHGRARADAQRHMASLLQNDQKVLALLNAAGNLLIVVDEQLIIQFVNRATVKILEMNEVDLLSRSISEILPPLETSLLRQMLAVSRDMQTLSLTLGDIELEGSVSLIARGVGEPKSLILSLNDVTRQKEREAYRTNLLRMALHDLSNPLHLAINYAELIQDGTLSGDMMGDGIVKIRSNLDRMRSLLDDLSLLERMNDDVNVTETFELVDLTKLAEAVVDDLVQHAANKNIKLQRETRATRLFVAGNSRLLQQAILNLTENAIKYTPPDGHVTVTIGKQEKQAEIRVEDNGIGIPKEKHDHLFEPFYRVKDPKATDIPGTGLGLSLVRSVAQRHGGSVWFESEPDKGSIFYLRIPLVPR